MGVSSYRQLVSCPSLVCWKKDFHVNPISTFPPCYPFHMIFTALAPRLIQYISRNVHNKNRAQKQLWPIPLLIPLKTMRTGAGSGFFAIQLWQSFQRHVCDDLAINLSTTQLDGVSMLIETLPLPTSPLCKILPFANPPLQSSYAFEPSKQYKIIWFKCTIGREGEG